NLVRDVRGGRLAFRRRRGGEDHFANPGIFGAWAHFIRTRKTRRAIAWDRYKPRQQVRNAQLLRPYPADGRQRAMQHVVGTVVAARLLDGRDVSGLFHDADDVLIAHRAGAVHARVDIGDVVADGAETKLRAKLENSGGERASVGIRG